MSLRWWKWGMAFMLLAGSGARLLWAQPAADEQAALSLEQAEAMALAENPSIAAVDSARLAARAQLSEARAGRLPMLQFSETFTNSNNPVFVFGSLLEQGRFASPHFATDFLNDPGSMSNFRSALNLRLPVFNRFEVESRVAQAEIGTEVADQQLELARQEIRLAVVRSYFGAHVARARLEVAAEAVKSTEAEVNRIRNLFEQGTVVASELLAMQVQLSDFQQQQIQAEGDLSDRLRCLEHGPRPTPGCRARS